MEIRLLRVNKAVQRRLVHSRIHWAQRKSPNGQIFRTDVLIIQHDADWEHFLPYFDHTLEKNGGKHQVQYEAKEPG